MSLLLKGNTSAVNNRALLHITSGVRTEDELNTTSMLSDTIFNSECTFLEALEYEEFTPVGSTFLQNGLSPSYNIYLRQFPNSISKTLGGDNIYLSYAYSISAGKCVSLHGYTSVSWNDLNNYTWKQSTINTTNYHTLGISSKFNGTPGPTFYMSCPESTYSTYSSILNASDLVLRAYKLNITYSGIYYSPYKYTNFTDVFLNNKEFKVNGIDLVDYKIVSMDYSSQIPFSVKGTKQAPNVLVNNTVESNYYGDIIAVNHSINSNLMTGSSVKLKSNYIEYNINGITHRIIHTQSNSHVKNYYAKTLNSSNGFTANITSNTDYGIFIVYFGRGPFIYGSSTTTAAVWGVTNPYVVIPVYKPYILNHTVELLNTFYREPAGYYLGLKITVSAIGTSYTVKVEPGINTSGVPSTSVAYFQYIEL